MSIISGDLFYTPSQIEEATSHCKVLKGRSGQSLNKNEVENNPKCQTQASVLSSNLNIALVIGGGILLYYFVIIYPAKLAAKH